MLTKKLMSGLALFVLLAPQAWAQKTETLKGYAEWRKGDVLIVDGQRVGTNAATKVKVTSKEKVGTFASIPLGDEVAAKGIRQTNGSVLAKEINAKPNGAGLFEAEILQATNDIEKQWVAGGAVTEEEEVDGKVNQKEIGKILANGPEVARARAILDRLVPAYVDAKDLRVYVIANKDWNAMAMANGAVWMFKGALDAMDDDEIAFILGHELAHVTHEHSRQAFRKSIWGLLITAGVWVAADQIDNKTTKTILQVAGIVAPMLWVNKYSRVQEDQADRVGLRYAYEAGYDPLKGPRLWERFQKKYGNTNRVVNFLIGDHSTAKARIQNLERQVALNYSGPFALRPKRRVVAGQEVKRPSGGVAYSRPRPAVDKGGMLEQKPASKNILPGMGQDVVRQILGEPDEQVVVQSQVKWVYDHFAVIFTNGRVTDVEFDPD